LPVWKPTRENPVTGKYPEIHQVFPVLPVLHHNRTTGYMIPCHPADFFGVFSFLAKEDPDMDASPGIFLGNRLVFL
jgi:hypothetical protein